MVLKLISKWAYILTIWSDGYFRSNGYFVSNNFFLPAIDIGKFVVLLRCLRWLATVISFRSEILLKLGMENQMLVRVMVLMFGSHIPTKSTGEHHPRDEGVNARIAHPYQEHRFLSCSRVKRY